MGVLVRIFLVHLGKRGIGLSFLRARQNKENSGVPNCGGFSVPGRRIAPASRGGGCTHLLSVNWKMPLEGGRGRGDGSWSELLRALYQAYEILNSAGSGRGCAGWGSKSV